MRWCWALCVACLLLPRETGAQPPTYLMQWGSFGTEAGQFDSPFSLAVDSQGNIFVVDYRNSRVQKFTPDGQFLLQWGSNGYGDGQFAKPVGIAIGPSDLVYVVCSLRNDVQEFLPDGSFQRKWTGGGSVIDVDAAGNVYVAADHTIRKYVNGTEVLTWGEYGYGDGKFGTIQGIAVDGSGYVYVADRTNGWFQKFTQDGDFVMRWTWPLGGRVEFIGLDVASNGTVHLADYWNSRMVSVSPDGESFFTWGGPGEEPGQFNSIWDVVLSQDGFIYTAEDYRIQKFATGPVPARPISWGHLKARFDK